MGLDSDKRFSFLGFSCDLSRFGMFAAVIAVILDVLCVVLFVPLYPLWCWSALKNWKKLSYVTYWSNTTRVLNMTKLEWWVLLVTWIIIVASIPFVISLQTEKEQREQEADRLFIMERDRQEREYNERHQRMLDSIYSSRDRSGTKNHGSPIRRHQPDMELEYYDEHFDDYHDDPEDGITYPDEIFDFYDD